MNTTVREIINEIDGIEPVYIQYKRYTNLSKDYADRLRKVLSGHMQTLFAEGRLSEANEVLVHVYTMTEQLSMNDYYQVLYEVIEDCLDYWRTIIHNSDGSLRSLLHEQFWRMAGETRIYDSYNETIEEFMDIEFADNRVDLKRRLVSLNARIRRRIKEPDQYIFRRAIGIGEDVVRELDIMRQLGYPQKDIDAVIRTFWRATEVRDRKAEMLIVQGDLDGAIQVLRESRELDKGDSIALIQSSETLIDLYRRLGRTEEYRQELVYYLFEAGSHQNDYSYKTRDSLISYVNRLEDACTPEEWEGYRERILQDTKFMSVWLQVMARDGLYERLLNTITDSGFCPPELAVRAMDHYEDLLKPLFPEQMRKFYADYITQRGETAMSRVQYAELMQYLVKLYHYPGGDEMALNIANQWLAKYPRRTAMKEELFKAGFQ